MNPDQKFIAFLKEWANAQGCTLEIESFDGRESHELIDGMAADDVWGWKVPFGEVRTDDHFGCAEWKKHSGKLTIKWKTYK